MQAHKLSSYNTEISSDVSVNQSASNCERKVELLNGKAILKTVAVKASKNSPLEHRAKQQNNDYFDIAGLAG